MLTEIQQAPRITINGIHQYSAYTVSGSHTYWPHSPASSRNTDQSVITGSGHARARILPFPCTRFIQNHHWEYNEHFHVVIVHLG